ncbi:hypothetical protein HU200_032650 [Digitaria exilis]|uniref:LIM zinc-binding domain-containing protein n=1 Tax=Digitaria exilis TaxID=1010633 RepID=A0A835BT89_9POAL|nr:hypothetical protein HU200_032650 [Digitaria exilis]
MLAPELSFPLPVSPWPSYPCGQFIFVYLPTYPGGGEKKRLGFALGDRVRAASGVGTMSFTGTQDKCTACDKTVHFIDLLTADGVPYHKTCFKCSHCKGILSMCNYSSMDGVLYCKTHFEQLFKETGSFSKKFTPGGKSSDKGELLTLEGESYHKSCFKCSHGGCILTTSSYAALNGVLYCKIHFAQLFMEKGSYSHMKKKSTSQEVMPDVAAEEQPPQPAPPQEEKEEDN